MSLYLTLHINLGLSLRKTAQALKYLYNVNISPQQIANYCKTAAICIKPFVDNYDYQPGNTFTTHETHIKFWGVKTYIWFIVNLALWVAYYNFLRPHKNNGDKVLNQVKMLQNADNMSSKWQLLIFLGQQTILNKQHGKAVNCS